MNAPVSSSTLMLHSPSSSPTRRSRSSPAGNPFSHPHRTSSQTWTGANGGGFGNFLGRMFGGGTRAAPAPVPVHDPDSYMSQLPPHLAAMVCEQLPVREHLTVFKRLDKFFVRFAPHPCTSSYRLASSPPHIQG